MMYRMYYFSSFIILTVIILTGVNVVFAQETVEDENKPMIAPTDKGSIDVELSWSPIPLEPEQTTQLHIRFLQKDKVTLQQHIDYKIFVENDGIEVFRIPLTHTNPGEVTIPYAFTSTGSFLIGVDVEGILFQPISKETATFSVVVVPEFPISVMFIMTIVIAATIISIRMKPYAKSIYKN